MCLTKLKVWKQFLAFIIIDTIVINFYKAIPNIRPAFSQAITEFFNIF